jgi:hypothetical protein
MHYILELWCQSLLNVPFNILKTSRVRHVVTVHFTKIIVSTEVVGYSLLLPHPISGP